MIKVALVKSPQKGSSVRGGGYYADHLLPTLSGKVDVSLVDFSPFPGAYQNFDLVHFSYFDEYFFTLPPILPQKTIISVLDCTKLKFPKHFPLGLRARLAWPWQKTLAQKAKAIITLSNSAKRDIVTFFDIEDSKVHSIYLAADKQFQPEKLKKEDFVLYVGGVNWNKNVGALIKACQKINVKLILVGKEFLAQNVDFGNVENQPLKEILALIKGDPNISTPGFVATKDLVKLYNQAKVYVQPSIYEGFGLPVLEAFSCDCPVICGKNSSLAEIAGEAATYADVTDVDNLADRITKVKKTGKELTQAKKFSWEKTAQETIKVYEEVLAGR